MTNDKMTLAAFNKAHKTADDIYNDDEHGSKVFRVAIYWNRDCAYIRAPSGQVQQVMWSHHDKAHSYIADTIDYMA
jgi:hypothetical protein